MSDRSDHCADHTDHFHGSASTVQVPTGLIYVRDLNDLHVFLQYSIPTTVVLVYNSVVYIVWPCYHACIYPGVFVASGSGSPDCMAVYGWMFQVMYYWPPTR